MTTFDDMHPVRPDSGLTGAKITCETLLVGLDLEPRSVVTCHATYTVSGVLDSP